MVGSPTSTPIKQQDMTATCPYWQEEKEAAMQESCVKFLAATRRRICTQTIQNSLCDIGIAMVHNYNYGIQLYYNGSFQETGTVRRRQW
ncbi:hypothetical protein AVEN_219623-1 [Araneus ventricosus]|uniref:Uncharacterized protein n=1 Tax=Araneus ventricosus TaxID=182803 RepID=A0A4Y2LHT1_ARAVE|nr:hypothetical protein AVEN_219623-1 [Araneus ventricosus]